MDDALQPVVNIIPLQLLSYHLTCLRYVPASAGAVGECASLVLLLPPLPPPLARPVACGALQAAAACGPLPPPLRCPASSLFVQWIQR